MTAIRALPITPVDIHIPVPSVEVARQWCRRRHGAAPRDSRVLLGLLRVGDRDDAIVIASFRRLVYELTHDIEDRPRSLERIAWWEEEIDRCPTAPRDPLSVAIADVVRRRHLPLSAFLTHLDAARTVIERPWYRSWSEVETLADGLAGEIGRLLVAFPGTAVDPGARRAAGRIASGLFLAESWRNLGREVVNPGRLLVPHDLVDVPRYRARLVESAARGHAVDRDFLAESRRIVRRCVVRTRTYLQPDGLDRIDDTIRPVFHAAAAWGNTILDTIERWDCDTSLHRPPVGKLKAWRIAQRAKSAGRVAASNAVKATPITAS